MCCMATEELSKWHVHLMHVCILLSMPRLNATTCAAHRNCMVMEGSSRKNVQQVIIKTFSIARMTETRRDRRNRELELLEVASAVPNVMRLICTAEDDENLYTILDACPGTASQGSPICPLPCTVLHDCTA